MPVTSRRNFVGTPRVWSDVNTRTNAAHRRENRQVVDQEALDLTLRALALLDKSATALELSRTIREHFSATASTSRIYVAIGQLWERGYVTVRPVPIRRAGRSTRQSLVTITPRGRNAFAAAALDVMAEDAPAPRPATSADAMGFARRRR
jgi:DNA-binding PadR family transcriptional regulator